MHAAISHELAQARIADLRRAGRPRRLGEQLWTLLHAQALLDGLAAAGGPSLAEDDHLRSAARRTSR